MKRRTFIELSALTVASSVLGTAVLGQTDSNLPARQTLPALPPPPSPSITQALFPGFTTEMVKTSGASILTLSGGSGPPLLLVHGHPETHVAWHKIAKQLARHFTVVLTDLRGYGDSSKPEGGPRSVNYSATAMALDQIEVMQSLGFNRFAVAGHDRGGRVASRMAIDFPKQISRLAVLDIAPTLTMYDRTNMEFATRYMWWFFQIQPYPLPEHMIGLDPGFYLQEHLKVQNKTPGSVTKLAMAEYVRCYCASKTIHAACEDYRAAAGIELEKDREDVRYGRKITAPLLALWGAKGTVGQLFDVLATWREQSSAEVSGAALDCGHLIPEEQPERTLEEFMRFFAA